MHCGRFAPQTWPIDTAICRQSRDAKRTAIAHSVFNISGAFLFIWFVKPYAKLIQYISPKGVEIEVISRQIANAHTGFNLIMTLFWLPLIPLLVKIVSVIVSDKSKDDISENAVISLDSKLMNQPTVALHLLSTEVMRCEKIVEEMLRKVCEVTINNEQLLLTDIEEKMRTLETLYKSVSEYISEMYSQGVMTEEQAGESTRLLYLLSDTYRIGSLCHEITATISNNIGKEMDFSEEAKGDLKESVKVIQDMYLYTMDAVTSGKTVATQDINHVREEMLLLNDKMRKAHIDRVGKKKCTAQLTATFNDILHDINRMGNSCVNLAEMASSVINCQLMV